MVKSYQNSNSYRNVNNVRMLLCRMGNILSRIESNSDYCQNFYVGTSKNIIFEKYKLIDSKYYKCL